MISKVDFTTFKILIIADEGEQISRLNSGLIRGGFSCSLASTGEEISGKIRGQTPDLVLIDMAGPPASPEPLLREVKAIAPIIAFIPQESLPELDFIQRVDDFVIKPYEIAEVIARVKRILWRSHNIDSKEVIECGDLVIDLARYEVSLSSKLIPLTFKEYELLKFLATNKGKVLTREILLDKLWGYDYYGGDRTVDVYIRRLRAKIEDENHCFIETVRNIGYKFRKEI